MNATIFPEKKHYPVLLKEIISIITPQYGGTFIDCTFGQGGYTKKILGYPKTKVLGLDRDQESIKISYFYKDNTYFEGGTGNRVKTIDRYSVIHKIEYSRDKYKISFCENVIYALRPKDMTYMIPMVPFWSLQHYLDDIDNLQMKDMCL